MTDKKNVLFIMCDQLRWDYLSCYGHPHLETPNIDRLAKRGVRFNHAYIQSPICGPSRMSFYTGRYVRSHGSNWNNFPLKVGELTLGDHLRPLGVDTVLVGKTHMRADKEGMERYGIEEGTVIGARLAECGFDVFERDDGLHPDGNYSANPRYNDYLKSKGYNDPNPWNTCANGVQPATEDETGLGWFLKYSNRPANVAEEDSETPYLTRRFMDFVESRTDDTPWMCHLSFIKPHWPYIVPEPYHNMYGPETWLPPVRSEAEKAAPHPVFGAFMNARVSQSFAKDEVRNTVMPAYMGLIKQIDDQMGHLFHFLEQKGLMENTMIVFTSDHGDYLGDHWLGEKELFHDPSVRVPLIVYDPSKTADATRGTVSEDLVEGIDLAATFLDFFGGTAIPHRLEGRSLLPILNGKTPEDWRDFAFSEYDFSPTPARIELGLEPNQCRLVMAVNHKWKYIYSDVFRPMLFDKENDPDELVDLAENPAYGDTLSTLKDAVFAWSRQQSQRITTSDGTIRKMTDGATKQGVLIGFWDENELADASPR